MKIAITRIPGKGADDDAICREFGHTCIHISPLVAEIDQQELDRFISAASRGEFDCIFFTSAYPAGRIAPHLEDPPRLVAIGPATAETLKGEGLHCEMLPAYYTREFARALGSWLKGRSVGIPRAKVPNPALIQAITEAGGIPHEFHVYRLKPTRRPLPIGGCDAILFTSALSFREAVFERREDLIYMAIGEITAEAMRQGGIEPGVVGDGSIRGTLQALESVVL